MVVHACNPSGGEVQTGTLGVWGYLAVSGQRDSVSWKAGSG